MDSDANESATVVDAAIGSSRSEHRRATEMLSVCRLAFRSAREDDETDSDWIKSVIRSFTGDDGCAPQGGVIFDKLGNLYGMTDGGGAYGYGTIFELTPSGSGWTETTLHSFQNATDGWNPGGGLIFDKAGNLYGSAPWGGPTGYGTVFELSPSNGDWTYTVLYKLYPRGSWAIQEPHN